MSRSSVNLEISYSFGDLNLYVYCGYRASIFRLIFYDALLIWGLILILDLNLSSWKSVRYSSSAEWVFCQCMGS